MSRYPRNPEEVLMEMENDQVMQVSLADVRNLVRHLQFFLSINQAHLDKYAKTADGQSAIKKAVKWAISQGHNLEQLNIKDDGQLSRNVMNILRFTKNLVEKLLPLYKKYIPNDIPQTLSKIIEIYKNIVQEMEDNYV